LPKSCSHITGLNTVTILKIILQNLKNRNHFKDETRSFQSNPSKFLEVKFYGHSGVTLGLPAPPKMAISFNLKKPYCSSRYAAICARVTPFRHGGVVFSGVGVAPNKAALGGAWRGVAGRSGAERSPAARRGAAGRTAPHAAAPRLTWQLADLL